jgi:hypothetical protein
VPELYVPVIPFWSLNSSWSPASKPPVMTTAADSRFESSASVTVSAPSTTTPAAFSV